MGALVGRIGRLKSSEALSMVREYMSVLDKEGHACSASDRDLDSVLT